MPGSLHDPVAEDQKSAIVDRRIVGRPYVVELASEVVAEARALLLRHPLRAADAVQLASCLVLQAKVDSPMIFAAYDQRLLEAARQQGLQVFDSDDPADFVVR